VVPKLISFSSCYLILIKLLTFSDVAEAGTGSKTAPAEMK
jgi:hypothetical protein